MLVLPRVALADWPTESQWIGVYKDNAPMTDPNGDSNGSRNVVSDSTHWAAMVYFDGTYFYSRMRMDNDPSGQGGQGLLKPYGWGVEFDTDQDDTDFEWLTILDGISQTESIRLFQNTVQGTLGDPGDRLEVEYTSLPLSGNYQIYAADTAFNGDQDYWIAWRFPYDTLKTALGVSDGAPIRLFFGSSSSANNLSENGADLCVPSGPATLANGLSDYILIDSARRPATGSVMFVESASSPFGNMTSVGTGDTIYIMVEDDDRNSDNLTAQTVEVTITVPSGDSETITLTETGPDTGIFTGSIPNALISLVSPGYTADNGTLQVIPGETATVTYTDLAAPNTVASLPPYQDVPRTDTLLLSAPALSVTKTVSPSSVAAGGTVTYTITITNSSNGAAVVTSVVDTLPAGFGYVSSSTTGFTTSDPAVSGQDLTWSGTWAVPRRVGSNDGSITLSFQSTAASTEGTYYNNVSVSGNNFTTVATGDTAPVTVLPAPHMVITKTVDQPSAVPGTVLTFTVHYHNSGGGDAYNLVLIDTVPANMTYVPGSLRAGGASSTYSTATPVTDAADGDAGEVSGGNIIFRISPVAPDDGASGSGDDEGKVYLQLQIDS